jgi:hypothetical protein
MKKNNESDASKLRQKAEQCLLRNPLKSVHHLSDIDIFKLNQELSIHQLELEMQNEELAFQLEEKVKLARELQVANKELLFQNEEKANRALDLIKRTVQLEELNSYFEGRELRMVELKKEINDLLKKGGMEKKYLI